MATPAEVLLALSPLPSGTPAEHLLAITAGGGGGDTPLVGVLVLPQSLAGVLELPFPLAGVLTQPAPLFGSISAPAPLAATIAMPAPLVGVLECDGENMTDISIPYGRSFQTPLNFFESDGTTPKDTTGAVVEWWVNDAPGDGTENAEIIKRSYDPSEIATVSELSGQYTLKVRAEDNELDLGAHVHCAVLTMRGAAATSVGTVDVLSGSGLITGSGIETANIHDGDLLAVTAGANSGRTVIVRHERDVAGDPTGNLVTSFDGWVTQVAASFTVYEADKPDVSGVDGGYTVEAC